MNEIKKLIISENQLKKVQKNIDLWDDIREISLPKHMERDLQSDKTSLGNHPSFPPDDESKFVYKLLRDSYSYVINQMNKFFPDLKIHNETECKKTLSMLLKQCYDLEKPLKSQLEMLVMNIIKEIFGVDKEDVDLSLEMVDHISDSDLNIPLKPEEVDDVEFDGIDDINGINDEIYKRRMVNCLMQGISNRIIHLYEYYVKDICDINADLFSLYQKIIALNELILFMEEGNIINENETTSGSTSEVIVKTSERSIVNIKGVNFLALLHESIRSLLDLISFNGLPKETDKAKYVIKKSDFRLASKWDERFGIPLWLKIESRLQEKTADIDVHVIPYLFYEIITLPVQDFNNLLVNVFAGTKVGKEELISMYERILYNLEKESFEGDLDNKRQSLLDDDKYFNIDDL